MADKITKTAASVRYSPKHSSIRTEALESLAAVRALAERYDCPRLGQALMDTEADHDLHPQCVELHSEGIGGGGAGGGDWETVTKGGGCGGEREPVAHWLSLVHYI